MGIYPANAPLRKLLRGAILSVILASLPLASAWAGYEPPPKDHRYLFPNGNELVFVPGRSGLTLERDGKVIKTFRDFENSLINVFPSTDSNSGWARGIPGSTYIADVPSAPIVLLEIQSRRSDSNPYIHSISQDGTQESVKLYWRQQEGTIGKPRLAPRWNQYYFNHDGQNFMLLTEIARDPQDRSVEAWVFREGLEEAPYIWTHQLKDALAPTFLNGKVALEKGAPPVDAVGEALRIAEDRGLLKNGGLSSIIPIRGFGPKPEPRVQQPAPPNPQDWRFVPGEGGIPWASLRYESLDRPFRVETRKLMPDLEKELEITENSADLEAARTFVALKQRHPQLIPTLVKIAKEKGGEVEHEGGRINRALQATRLLVDYAELDPRALEALDRIATEGGNEKARHVAQMEAKLLREELLSPEGKAELFKCMRGYRSL